MCMSIYACKCDVPLKKLKEDMAEDFLIVSKSKHTNPLTEDDIKSALEMYSREYFNFKIDDIEKLTDIRIERNKRNGRKQDVHLERARAVQMIDYPNREWINKEGAPTKQSTVQKWRLEHPDGKKADCIRDTGLDKKTVYKWWNNQ